ncbi:hypothetical protein OBV_33000 [Oscillibacter valericigenes Sjm18-20]|nr:hypothetical protein OBV_33000 [Oscillibacter valericigenes Sjm18-20]
MYFLVAIKKEKAWSRVKDPLHAFIFGFSAAAHTHCGRVPFSTCSRIPAKKKSSKPY